MEKQLNYHFRKFTLAGLLSIYGVRKYWKECMSEKDIASSRGKKPQAVGRSQQEKRQFGELLEEL